MPREMTLRDLRRRNGKILKDVAESLGVSITSVSEWECGHYEPSARLIPKLAKTLKTDPDTILTALSIARRQYAEQILQDQEVAPRQSKKR